jgi:hypothetical protein
MGWARIFMRTSKGLKNGATLAVAMRIHGRFGVSLNSLYIFKVPLCGGLGPVRQKISVSIAIGVK